MGKSWQRQERLVASWFTTFRTPLSGRNDRNDDGSQRLGDILYKHAVIEVKRRKKVDMSVGMATKALADGLPWLVLEFKTARSGSAPEANMVKLTMDHKTAEIVCKCLDAIWKVQP